jgi:hypothetical protein
MPQISPDTLMPLEVYAKARPEFRAKVIEHKKDRTLQLGENLTLIFEDELTIRYQVQEMLRVERIFEQEGILDELGAYNPLVPDGSNWKATMLIEYPDENERRTRLAQLIGIEDKVWVQVAGSDRVFAIADEDLERENEQKTSSVHFLRFELTASMVSALRGGGALAMGVDHPNYSATAARISDAMCASLMADLA